MILIIPSYNFTTHVIGLAEETLLSHLIYQTVKTIDSKEMGTSPRNLKQEKEKVLARGVAYLPRKEKSGSWDSLSDHLTG